MRSWAGRAVRFGEHGGLSARYCKDVLVGVGEREVWWGNLAGALEFLVVVGSGAARFSF